MKGKQSQMDLSFLPDQENDDEEFENCRYSEKEKETIYILFGHLIKKELDDLRFCDIDSFKEG